MIEQLIQAVRRLYKTPGQHLTLGQVVELNRKLLEGYVHFQNEPQVQKLRKDVLKYNRLVRDLGLRDHQASKKNVNHLKPNLISHLGSACAEGELEDIEFTDVPHLPTSHLDASRPTGDHTKWTNVHFGIYHLKAKGQRYVFSVNFT